MSLSLASVVVQRPDHVSSTTEDGTKLLSVHASSYFVLDDVGTAIWNILERPTRLADVCAALVREFEVDSATCERDVLAFTGELLTRQLVRIA